VGVEDVSDGPVTLENSTLAGAAYYGLWAAAPALHRLQMSNVTFTDNMTNRIFVPSGAGPSSTTLADDAVLTAQPGLEGYEWDFERYQPDSADIDFIIPNGVTLTLQPGVALMGRRALLVEQGGRLLANGTATEPVTLASLATEPGSWTGLHVAGAAQLQHTDIASALQAVHNAGGRVLLRNSTLHDNSAGALFVEGGGDVTAVCSSFADNGGDGVHVAPAATTTVTLHGNSITGNGGLGVYNESSPLLDARYNWWGDASSPGGDGPGSGDAVSGTVRYEPWLSKPGCAFALPPEVRIGLEGEVVRLTWASSPLNEGYEVWRNAAPYFAPGDPGVEVVAQLPAPDAVQTLAYTETAGSTAVYFRAVAVNGEEQAPGADVGIFRFPLEPGADAPAAESNKQASNHAAASSPGLVVNGVPNDPDSRHYPSRPLRRVRHLRPRQPRSLLALHAGGRLCRLGRGRL
jgi:hypothetical protein